MQNKKGFFLHFRLFFCIFASGKAVAGTLQANTKSPNHQVFWRPPQGIRTHATRYCPARRNNLPRAGQISNIPSRSLLHPVSLPARTGAFPLFLLLLFPGAYLSVFSPVSLPFGTSSFTPNVFLLKNNWK